jgi:competence protein ComFB
MEEMVYAAVNDLFDTAKMNKAPWLTCSCNQCRLDTICYVLNQMPPRYIKSGRGLAYSQFEDATTDKSQLAADIRRIGLEGMKKVLSSKRPHTRLPTDLPDAPVFNFPTFVGRIFDGQTFEPAKDVSVLLLMDSVKAESIDHSWENPYHITAHTPGTFTFWVKPVGAENDGQKKVFPFEIQVKRRGFDPIQYFFELGVTSESIIRTAYTAEHAFILPDLHLFPIKDGLESMQE